MNRMQRLFVAFIGSGLLAGALLLAVLMPGAPPAILAQSGYVIPTLTPTAIPTATLVPTADPAATAAAAVFDIGITTLESNYPDGVTYVVEATSSAAPIERVQVSYWTHDSTPTSASLTWDESRQAYTYFDRMHQSPWFEITYRFRIRDAAGNTYETEELKAEYADNTRKWVRRENDQVIVLMTGARESLADDLFASASAAILRLEDAFGFSLDYRPYVVVMDHASFQEWQQSPDPTLAGQTTTGYTVQTLSFGESDLVDTTVPHELTHIFQGFITEARDIPGWFIEGHATYFEPVQQYDYEARVRSIVNLPRFPTLQDNFSPGGDGPDGRNRIGYDVGYTFIKYWIETYGWESHRVFWQAQVELNFEEALQLATGKSLPELENDWRAWLGATAPAPTLIPLPTMPPFPTAPGMSSAGGGS